MAIKQAMIKQWEYAQKENENGCDRAWRLNVITQMPDDLFKPDYIHVFTNGIHDSGDFMLCDCKSMILFAPDFDDEGMPCLVVEVD